MNYEALTAQMQGDLLRGHLLQAEADHFVHSLQCEEAQATLAKLPDKDDRRPALEADIAELEHLAAVAAGKAALVAAKLDELGEPKTQAAADAQRAELDAKQAAE